MNPTTALQNATPNAPAFPRAENKRFWLDCIEELSPQEDDENNHLDVCADWIVNNYTPEQVYSPIDLHKWAMDNGYTKPPK